METLKLLIIGIIQGVTELLPISSSAHILILGKLLRIDVSSLLLVTFHLGTTVAILIFFGKKLLNILSKKNFNFFLKLIVATIPAGIAGLLFDDFISEKLRAEWIIALSLIVWGIVMIILERKKEEKTQPSDISNISWKQAILIGLSQAVALIPGTSRSGITTITGILLGLKKYIALEFSFILSIPILLGTFFWMLLKNHTVEKLTEVIGTPLVLNFLAIFLSTLIVGMGTLLLLKKFRKEKWLTVFGIYRIILGIILLVVFYL